MLLSVYYFVSALVFLLLSLAWNDADPTQKAIRWTFRFLFVWGIFFGILALKSYIVFGGLK